MTMNKRVYGVIGVKSIMANWNADFSGYPKTISNGEYFGSDKSLKFTMKKMWENNGENVLYIKSLKIDKDKKDTTKVRPKTLKERYEELFKIEDLKKEKDSKKVLKNIFTTIDVKNFGATFAEEGNNIGITGAVQIGQGFNKYKNSQAEEQQILSPFRDSKAKEKNKDGEDAASTTLGTKIISDEAHYFYPFSVNPLVYNSYVDMDVTEGYTEADYNKFKDAAIISATAYNTNSKLGCENEFAIFIETDEELYLPDLAQYITFEKNVSSEKDIINLEFSQILNSLESKINNIEIYYNPYKLKINTTLKNVKYINIITREGV